MAEVDPDAELLALLRVTFRAEAQEHLAAVRSALLELEKLGPGDARAGGLVESVFREAHSLKGAARAVGLPVIEGACQRIEGVFALWKKGAWVPSAERFDALHRCAELLGEIAAADGEGVQSQVAALNSVLGTLGDGAAVEGRDSSVPMVVPGAVAAGEFSGDAVPRPLGAESVRIATDKLDRLVLQAEEMLAVKQSAGRRAAELREARRFFERWKKQWAGFEQRLSAGRAAAGGDDAGLDDFLDSSRRALEELEQRLALLLKAAEQDAHATGRMVGDLLEDSKRLLLTPLDSLFASLPLAVRELARELGREAAVSVRGGGFELDRRIIEEMKDAMLHLVRNAVDHGVEPPEVRERAGKPRMATISISAAQAEGGRVEISVADDGAGIDAVRVREAAVRAGLLGAEAARALPDEEALRLIFASDVSTTRVVTEISGRGLGLAIVREKAEKLGGSVAVRSQAGTGTVFTIRLPVTLATFRGVILRCAGQVFVVPTAAVAHVTRVRGEELRRVEGREGVERGGQFLPCYKLAEVLRAVEPPVEEQSAWFPAVVLGEGAERAAFLVDEVLGEEEVLVKRLGAPLVRVRHIAAATVLQSGRAAPVLHAGDLLASALRQAGVVRVAASTPRVRARRRVLVAEDSVTSRLLLKSIAESAGCEVRLAADGQDALALLHAEPFDLVLSDVDMPRMNGLSLTRRIRADRRLAALPVVLITAQASAEDRARGIEAGASEYIEKGGFNQTSLLDAIRRLAGP